MNRNSLAAALTVAAIALGGCANMSHQDKATVAGAAIGGVAGNMLTDSALGTVGGAAVGGYIGHEVGKKK